MPNKKLSVTVEPGKSFDAYVALPPAGAGPAVVILQEIFGVNKSLRDVADSYAEEGYVAVVPDLFWRFGHGIELGYEPQDFEKAMDYYKRFSEDDAVKDIAATLKAVRAMPELRGKIGTVGFCLGGKLAYLAAAHTDVDCAVCYYGVGIQERLEDVARIECPIVFHFGDQDGLTPLAAVEQVRAAVAGREGVELYVYAGAGHAFASRDRDTFVKPAAMMAHSRSIAALRKALGPRYDLSALWDKHTEYEFATRDVRATMGTMVAEPYVNHIPTMTGGVGQKHLARFYKYHFIPKTPKDTKLIPISRTVGADRVVDEMLFCFTHDIEIDWMLPGVAPTGRYVEIPLVAIVCFRGDKLYHEHIYWDQASVLVQIGLLDAGKLPVAGAATAKKLLDESLPSNTLMKRWAESEGKPV